MEKFVRGIKYSGRCRNMSGEQGGNGGDKVGENTRPRRDWNREKFGFICLNQLQNLPLTAPFLILSSLYKDDE